MPEKKPLVAIVLLNWNGWTDTVECLESVWKLDYDNLFCILLDNDSKDDSRERLSEWARINLDHPGHFSDINEFRSFESKENGKNLVLLKSRENLGFAGGCNAGIQIALDHFADIIWLLNNDTVVNPDVLAKSVDFLKNHPEFAGLTGQIRYYHEPSRVWNCGGKLYRFGTRKYYYAGAQVENTPQNGHIPISFITGCSAMLRSSVFREIGGLSDRFFFGEEDFDFSYRLKRKGFSLACLFDTIIYHKVGGSVGPVFDRSKIGRAYIHYLNRFVFMKKILPGAVWHLWRIISSTYIFYFLKRRYAMSPWEIFRLLKKLFRDSLKMNRVGKDVFESAQSMEFFQRDESEK